ncbi:MAG: N4-gp56 family major capsid protein, partial [Clostridia bacterium]
MPNIINQTGSQGVAVSIAQYYDRKLLEKAVPQLIHCRDAQMRTLPRNNGRTVQFRKMVPFAPITSALSEGVTPDGQKLNQTELRATIAPYGGYVEMTDELNWVTLDNLHRETADLLADQAALSVDTVARDALHAGTNVMYGGGKTTRGALTSADVMDGTLLRKAVRFLKNQNCRAFDDGYYHAIIDPDTAYDLMSDAAWIDPAKYQDKSAIERGELGCLYGVKFFESTNAKQFYAAEEIVAGVEMLRVAVSSHWNATTKTLSLLDAALTSVQQTALANKNINIQGVTATIASATANTLVLTTAPAQAAGWAGATITPTGGGASGAKVASTLVYGKHAFGCVQLDGTGKNIQTIIKPHGSSGTEDPLNQRGTIGWKVNGFCQV